MSFAQYIQAYQGTPSIDELKQVQVLLEQMILDFDLNSRLSAFNPKFLKFLETGDITELAPTGTMAPEIYEATKSYVFCSIEHVSGRTVLARYLSGKNFTGVIPENSPLLKELVRGPCIVRHENNQIADWLALDKELLHTLGALFNNVASKSKGKK